MKIVVVYNYLDLSNIVSNLEDCPELIGDNICSAIKRGDIRFSVDDIRDFQSIKYLFSRSNLVGEMSDDVKNLLVDRLNDICSTCTFPTATTTTNACVDNAVLAEDGDCLITENGNDIIIDG